MDIKLHKAHVSTSSDHPGCPKVITWVMCLMWLKVKIIICRKWKHYCQCQSIPMLHQRAWGTRFFQYLWSLQPTERFLQRPRAFGEGPTCQKVSCNVILLSSGRKQKAEIQLPAHNSSEFRKYEALDYIQHLFWHLKSHTRNKTECGEAFYSKCIQETAWASVKTT